MKLPGCVVVCFGLGLVWAGSAEAQFKISYPEAVLKGRFREQARPVRIDELKADITIDGNVASTTLKIVFTIC